MIAPTIFTPDEAKKCILSGKARGPMRVDGTLNLANATQLKKLPDGLRCYELDITNTAVREFPEGLIVENQIIARNVHTLKSIPALTTGTLDVAGCNSLQLLPDNLDVWFLNIRGCSRLQSLPSKGRIRNGSLLMSGCYLIDRIPPSIRKLSTLDISDCPRISSLPASLEIGLWIDVGGSGIKLLKPPNDRVGIRWRGVPIDHRIAFRPQELSAEEALRERNAERRRVMIEHMGISNFIRQANPKVLDRDKDAGGERELLKIQLNGDEDMVCISCNCPSTGRHYLLRVPPSMMSCHQAAAWMAGFDDPDLYDPIIET